jgi:hypothetical protein
VLEQIDEQMEDAGLEVDGLAALAQQLGRDVDLELAEA